MPFDNVLVDLSNNIVTNLSNNAVSDLSNNIVTNLSNIMFDLIKEKINNKDILQTLNMISTNMPMQQLCLKRSINCVEVVTLTKFCGKLLSFT